MNACCSSAPQTPQYTVSASILRAPRAFHQTPPMFPFRSVTHKTHKGAADPPPHNFFGKKVFIRTRDIGRDSALSAKQLDGKNAALERLR